MVATYVMVDSSSKPGVGALKTLAWTVGAIQTSFLYVGPILALEMQSCRGAALRLGS